MADPIVLDYGQRPRAGWRRVARVLLIATAAVALIVAGVFAFRTASQILARRAGYAQVVAWYTLAQTTTVPAGTLLYSEDQADHPLGRFTRTSGGFTRAYVTFSSTQPTLRTILHHRGGVPFAADDDVLYAHEHATWTASSGPAPAMVCVNYRGLSPTGAPVFAAMSYRVNPIGEKVWFAGHGAATSPPPPPAGRSLAHLRIFAGVPSATDATRFALPFACDGGRGRFEFKTDGNFGPDVWIEWDDAPATQPDS